MKRVPPSVRMKEDVERLLRAEGPAEALGPMDGFVRATAQYILQVAIEAEATAFLGRGHYRRGELQRIGWRNGYEPKTVQTEAGLLQLAVPQLRATAEPFRPVLPARLGQRSVDLEGLVRGMSVRGLSTQEVSDRSGEAFGASRLSQSTVSRLTQQLNQELDTWRRRDLSELKVVYLFLDSQYHAARQGTDEKEGVLSADALLDEGPAVLRHLDLGPRESYDAWLGLLQDLSARGCGEPPLVIFRRGAGPEEGDQANGAAGLAAARLGAHDAEHLGQGAAAHAGADDALGAAGLAGAERRGRDRARAGAPRARPGPVLGGQGERAG